MVVFNEGDRVIVVVDGSDQEVMVKRVGREGRALVVELASKQLRTVSAELARKVVNALEIGKQVHEAILQGKAATSQEAKAIIAKFNEKPIIDEKQTSKPRKKREPKPAKTPTEIKTETALKALPEELKGMVSIGAKDISATVSSDLMAQADLMAAEATEKLQQLKPGKAKKIEPVIVKTEVKMTATEEVAAELSFDKEKRNGVIKRAFEMGLRNSDIAEMMGMKRRRVSQIRGELQRLGMTFPEPGGHHDKYIEAKKQFAILLK